MSEMREGSASRQEHKGRMHKAANGRDRTCPGNVCVVYLNRVKESIERKKGEYIERDIYTRIVLRSGILQALYICITKIVQ